MGVENGGKMAHTFQHAVVRTCGLHVLTPLLPPVVVCSTSMHLQGSATRRFTMPLQQTLSKELLVDGFF